MTSRAESFGMSSMEALLCNCPVVSSRVGALTVFEEETAAVGFYDTDDWSGAARLVQGMLGVRTPRTAALDRVREQISKSFGAAGAAEAFFAAVSRAQGA